MNENYRKFNSGRFGTGQMDIEYSHKLNKQVSATNMKGSTKDDTKDNKGNTYKDKETANEFDSQDSEMSSGFMSKIMGMFGG